MQKEKIAQAEKETILNRITVTESYEAVSEADLVIEAIYENLDAKKAIFREIEPKKKQGAILASNTSSLSLTAIASVLKEPERFIGLHFFYPAPVMALLEIVAGLKTSPQTLDAAREIGRALKKEVIVAKDSPGFIVNRMLVVMLNEAVCAYSEGVGSKEDIDRGLALGCNHPVGPLSLIDMLGLDIVCAVMEAFYRDFADSKYRPAPLLRKMAAAGMLGKKSGQGFYTYDAKGQKIEA
ncbi:3-hydroxybutyryl-CoA dehydrogenase [Spirochaetia bacterium]|nr:3-hydroxybutyryl-CoA dehydrogenase [Spirochaetia bacterium]